MSNPCAVASLSSLQTTYQAPIANEASEASTACIRLTELRFEPNFPNLRPDLALSRCFNETIQKLFSKYDVGSKTEFAVVFSHPGIPESGSFTLTFQDRENFSGEVIVAKIMKLLPPGIVLNLCQKFDVAFHLYQEHTFVLAPPEIKEEIKDEDYEAENLE